MRFGSWSLWFLRWKDSHPASMMNVQERAVVHFFHAEDGIRGGLVTGVQTCALPIFGLDDALPERFAPTVGVNPTTLVRIGERSDLTSNSASLPMAGTSGIRIDAEESLTVAELSQCTTPVAEELVERVITAFPRR